jgi:hypothetical protein
LDCQWLLEVDDSSPRLWLHKVKQRGQFKRGEQGGGNIRLKDFMQGVMRQVGQRMTREKVAGRVGQRLLVGRGVEVLQPIVKEKRPSVR